jgi:uncharacterized HAD superfamily protein
MRFGIDVDAVLADTVNEILRRINGQYTLQMCLDDVTEYYVDVWLGDRPELGDLRTRLLYDNAFYGALPPLADAVESVRVLTQQGPCYFITARPEEFQAVTAEWVARQGFPAEIPVICTWYKAQLAGELGLTHFAEDSHEQAERLAAAGLEVFLFDYPWNRHVVCDPTPSGLANDGGGRIVRVQSWRQVLQVLGLG